METWVWRNLRLELPEDWEMLQFSRNPEAGRCAWADRYQFRLELSWQAAARPPDMERLVSDYMAKLRTTGAMPDARRCDAAGWRGIRGHEGGMLTSRFSRHFAPERCLVEAVFLWPEGEGHPKARLRTEGLAEEERILESVAAEPERADGLRRWRAFGMDLLASKGLALHDCSVEPALARMAFGDGRGGAQETFLRLGLVCEWLKGSIADWLRQQRPADVEVLSEERSERAGHAVAAVVGARKPALFRRGSAYVAAAWQCPRDKRVYCASFSGTSACEPNALAGRRLACCNEMGMNGHILAADA